MIKTILDFLLPPVCHICGDTLLEDEHFLCGRCEAGLTRTFYHLSPDNATAMKLAGLFPFTRATSHFFYTHHSKIATLIHDFKYRNYPSLATHLGSIMGSELMMAGYLSDIDLIMPLPIHWTKRLRRGYNQTEYLARGISKSTGIPVSLDLKCNKAHKSQTKYSSEARKALTDNIFTLRNPGRYHGKHLLIIDDVCTTGATITAAAQAILRDAPGATISIATLSAAT